MASSQAEICHEMQIGRRRVRQHVQRLRELGLVYGGGPRKKPAVKFPPNLETWPDELLAAEYGAGGIVNGLQVW